VVGGEFVRVSVRAGEVGLRIGLARARGGVGIAFIIAISESWDLSFPAGVNCTTSCTRVLGFCERMIDCVTYVIDFGLWVQVL
jgi:hypothetical protein